MFIMHILLYFCNTSLLFFLPSYNVYTFFYISLRTGLSLHPWLINTGGRVVYAKLFLVRLL